MPSVINEKVKNVMAHYKVIFSLSFEREWREFLSKNGKKYVGNSSMLVGPYEQTGVGGYVKPRTAIICKHFHN